MCIYKGIHPVQPGLKRLRKNKGKTWYVLYYLITTPSLFLHTLLFTPTIRYYLKDINFMNRDEIVQWFRDIKIYKKRKAYLKVWVTPSE